MYTESQAQKIKTFETSSLSSLENEDLREKIRLLIDELEHINGLLERKDQEVKELREKLGQLTSKASEKDYLLRIEFLEVLSSFSLKTFIISLFYIICLYTKVDNFNSQSL